MPWPPPPMPPSSKALLSQDTTATPLARSKGQQQQTYVVNKSYTLILAADNTPQQVQGFSVPDGTAVRVRANNGTTTGNAQMIFIAGFPGAFKPGHGTPLTAVDDVPWPSTNGSQIWVYGKKGDGVIVSVTTVAGL